MGKSWAENLLFFFPPSIPRPAALSLVHVTAALLIIFSSLSNVRGNGIGMLSELATEHDGWTTPRSCPFTSTLNEETKIHPCDPSFSFSFSFSLPFFVIYIIL